MDWNISAREYSIQSPRVPVARGAGVVVGVGLDHTTGARFVTESSRTAPLVAKV